LISRLFSLTQHLVSWNWNGSHPSGTAAEVKPGEVTVVSHRGNEIKKAGDESNPAVHIERSGNDVVKTANELHVDQKAEGSSSSGNTNGDSSKPEEKKNEEKNPVEEKKEEKKDEEGEAQTGEKRKADEQADTDAEKAGEKETEKEKEGDDAKKIKKSNGDAAPAPAPAKENGDKKKAGRPKGNGPKKEKKVPAVGQAQRKTRSQGKVD
jgi:hypothetical protein